MIRLLFAASLAATLVGCASIPKSTPPPAHKAQVVRAKPAPIATAEPDKKKLTFKERWLSRFFRNRAQ